MTTIVLTHPNEHNLGFQIFAVYDAPDVRQVFALQELNGRDEAEWFARHMMEACEADHFRRVVHAGERIA